MPITNPDAIYRREWLTVPQAALRAGIAARTLRAATLGVDAKLKLHVFPGTKTPRVRWSEVEALLEASVIDPPEAPAAPPTSSARRSQVPPLVAEWLEETMT